MRKQLAFLVFYIESSWCCFLENTRFFLEQAMSGHSADTTTRSLSSAVGRKECTGEWFSGPANNLHAF